MGNGLIFLHDLLIAMGTEKAGVRATVVLVKVRAEGVLRQIRRHNTETRDERTTRC